MVKGRAVRVPRAAMGVARFSFHDLCEQPLGAADYLQDRARIPHRPDRSHSGHGLRPAQRGQALHHPDRHALRQCGEARRLGRRPSPTRSIARAKASRRHEFRRTASRLIEMRSQAYLALPHGRGTRLASGSTEGIVET